MAAASALYTSNARASFIDAIVKTLTLGQVFSISQQFSGHNSGHHHSQR